MITNPMEEIAHRSTEWLKSASHEEIMDLLKAAGVVDRDGHLAARYRPEPRDAAADAGAPANGSGQVR